MTIGIDASRAFLAKRTGIEEYSYQTIKYLRDVIPSETRVILYVRKKFKTGVPAIDFELPSNWEVRGLMSPRFWTQARLSLEMLLRAPDALFVPAHVVPLIHPKNTVVTIHGLEYEVCPQAYSWYERVYMRLSIRFSVAMAEQVIAVSENTKNDLIRLYEVPAEKITVVYEGFEEEAQGIPEEKNIEPYLLFIGRLEERKNISGIIEAFEILKMQHHIPHKLYLVGKPGYGYEKIKKSEDVVELGYVSNEEKQQLLKGADVFVFPTLYEGFGLPVLEAQAEGVPVVTSNSSSLPEIGGEGAVYVDPKDEESIADGIKKVLDSAEFRNDIIRKATANVGRFSWAQCAKEIAGLLATQRAETARDNKGDTEQRGVFPGDGDA